LAASQTCSAAFALCSLILESSIFHASPYKSTISIT
jgi:hypothetical protein